MTDRLSSGSDRLDTVLGGGLPRNGIVLIGGNPGSGKTILAAAICLPQRQHRPARDLSDHSVRTA